MKLNPDLSFILQIADYFEKKIFRRYCTPLYLWQLSYSWRPPPGPFSAPAPAGWWRGEQRSSRSSRGHISTAAVGSLSACKYCSKRAQGRCNEKYLSFYFNLFLRPVAFFPENESFSKIKVGKVGTNCNAWQNVDQTQFSSCRPGRINLRSFHGEPSNHLIHLKKNCQDWTYQWRFLKLTFCLSPR